LKKLFILFAIFFISLVSLAQLQSPQQFLGYQLGTRYTPHYKIVAYFQHLASQSPMALVKYYGTTNEHRELLAAVVGTEENIKKLDQIRKENIAVSEGKSGFDSQQPVIVWLSYNVHGNEPTSSEAAMQTLYDLVNPIETKTKEWLKNSIVVIDPCLNPDGRDRYANWFNSVVGNNYDATPLAREHREPWPQGRSNHYYFDLNRDWAWQTQKESKQRLAFYNSWLPQIHVDFHEQGYNSPYYFAPAAEPFHDVLTKFQRDFQVTIGKNHAGYFDKNGWLYFTRERFDLFYPSYGDTYPLYNGAIGMTYEQGGISGGLGVITKDDDTLTLVDRVAHHVTTGLSTIEISSKNSARILSEYKKYFADALAGKYDINQSYVIKYKDVDAMRIASLKELLNKNQIEYGTGSGSYKGYNYHTQKEESFSLEEKDMVITTRQRKGALVRVLFEQKSRLTDSITYDITAWSLPYVYGVDAYASKSSIAIKNETKEPIANQLNEAYGYVFPWSGVPSVKMAVSLLQQNVKLRVSEKAFKFKGKTYSAGTVLVLRTSNESRKASLKSILQQAGNEFNVPVEEIGSGMMDEGFDFGSSGVWSIKKPRVVLLAGSSVSSLAVGEVWSFFDNILNYPISIVNTEDFNRIDWNNTDVLIMPEGSYGFLSVKSQSDMLGNWIRNGGTLITMESATQQISTQGWSNLKLRHISLDSAAAKKVEKSNYANREREEVSKGTPGAIFKLEIDNTHPLMFGYPDYYYTLKQDRIFYDPITADGWNVGVLKDTKQVAGYVGQQLSSNLKSGVVIAVQDLGRGQVVYFADDVLFRNFWNNGMLMFANAVFIVGNN